MATTENEEAYTTLSNSTRVHIAQLHEFYETSSNEHIEAGIVLVWPYSSSTKQLSLLLVENDVSLRKAKGQVKVTFHDAVGRQVARLKPGVGDSVKLSLQGVEVVEEQDEVSTPGKKAGFTLHNSQVVQLEIVSPSGHIQAINFVASTPSPSRVRLLANGHAIEFETPNLTPSLNVHKNRRPSNATPVFRTSTRLSSNSFPDSIVDPFTEEDGFVPGRGRKRTKFARHSGAWRLASAADDEPAATDTEDPSQDESILASRNEQLPELQDETDTANEPAVVKAIEPEPEPVLGKDADDFGLASSHDSIHSTEPIVEDFKIQPEPTRQAQSPAASIHEQIDLDELDVLSVTQQIPVERLSPEEANVISPSGLEALHQSSLPLLSPMVTQASPILPLSSQGLELDASGVHSDHFGTLEGLVEVPNIDGHVSEQAEFNLQDVPQSIEQMFSDSNSQLAIPPQPVNVQEIDLDSLQQQIELENAEDSTAEVADEIVDGKDRHEMPHLEQPAEEGHLRRGSAEAPENIAYGSSTDTPVILDDESSEEEQEEKVEVEEQQDEEEVLEEEGTENDQSEHAQVDDQYASMEGLLVDNDDSVSLASSPSIKSQQPIHVQEIREDIGDDQSQSSDSQVLTTESEPIPQAAIHQPSEGDHSATDKEEEAQLTAPVESSASSSEDALSIVARSDDEGEHSVDQLESSMLVDEVMGDISVDEVLADVLLDTSDPVNDNIEGNHSHESTEESELSDTELEGTVIGSFELPTPQATYSAEQIIHGREAELPVMHEVPPTPADSQLLDTLPQPETTNDNLPQPLPQIDGTPANRHDRLELGKPRMSDGLYSAYFTPRKSTITNEASEAAAAQKSPEPSKMYWTRRAGSEPQANDEPVAGTHHKHSALPLPDVSTAPSSSSQGTTTNIAYYVQTNHLGQYYNQQVDVIAVCTTNSTIPERASSGPKDFHTTIHLTDTSSPDTENRSITAQIFRPRKNAIPKAQRGDVLLLRNFKVQTQSHKPLLLSTDESAWAVFRPENGGLEVTIAGPPVEHGQGEEATVTSLVRWWTTEGLKRYPDTPVVRSQTPDPMNGGVVMKRPRPPPLELRRSPRRTRQSGENDQNNRDDARSPSFNPQSPTLSTGTARSSMLLPSASASIASPTSPVSPMTTRNTRSGSTPTVRGHGRAANRSQHVSASPPPVPAPAGPTSRTQSQPAAEVKSSPEPASEAHAASQRASHTPNPVSRDFSPSTNSVITSVSGYTSPSSSKKHKHVRRSTGLIHELRDGTEYVDINEEEILSVSDDAELRAGDVFIDEDGDEEEGEGGDEEEAIPEYVGQDEHAEVPTRTPSRSTRAQSRNPPEATSRVEVPSISAVEQAQQSQSPGRASVAATVAASTGRTTRSKSKSVSGIPNIHELRDGATYED